MNLEKVIESLIINNKEVQDWIRNATPYGNDKRSLAHRINDFWIQDCSATIENMILLATNLGIGTCWCGVLSLRYSN